LRPTRIRDKEMKQFKIFTIFAFVMSAFVLAGCEKNDDNGKVKVDAQGLTQNIRDLIPNDILQGIEDLGMPIYGGDLFLLLIKFI